jgi:hypothetical protein
MNKTLAFISIFLVSLFVIGAVSATDNVTEDVVISNAEDADVISVDNEDVQVSTDLIEKENIVKDAETTINSSNTDDGNSADQTGTDSNILGVSDSDSAVSIGGNSNGTGFDFKSLFNGTTFNSGNGTGFNISDLLNGTISFGNGTSFNVSELLNGNFSFGNGTSFNISSLLNGTMGNGTFDISSILDMFGGNTKTDSITASDLTTYYAQNTQFKVTVKNGNETLKSGSVIFTIDNKEYVGHIGSDGVATVNIKNLKPGTHYIISEYGQTLAKNVITVKKSIITKDVTKKVKKNGKFTVKILDKNGKAYAKQKVKIKFKGKTYTKKTNKKGIVTLKLNKKIKAGKYTVKTTYAGLTVTNKITVKK